MGSSSGLHVAAWGLGEVPFSLQSSTRRGADAMCLRWPNVLSADAGALTGTPVSVQWLVGQC